MAHSLKNSTPQTELKVGDVALIEEDRKNKILWKLGKTERAIPGSYSLNHIRSDNHIRSYEVKTANGLL